MRVLQNVLYSIDELREKLGSFRITKEWSSDWCNLDKARQRLNDNRGWVSKNMSIYPDAVHNPRLLTMGERVDGREWYKSKKSWRVVKSKNAGRQLVGIWTVQRSSEDSSVEVPIKSNVRQLWPRRSRWLTNASCETVIRLCWILYFYQIPT